jgi:hypothetical protein
VRLTQLFQWQTTSPVADFLAKRLVSFSLQLNAFNWFAF